jgi:hypothetical protein
MSSQRSNDNQNSENIEIECIWCGVSKRLFPNLDIRWAVIDAKNNVGICEECWDVLPEQERDLKSWGDGDSDTSKGVDQ